MAFNVENIINKKIDIQQLSVFLEQIGIENKITGENKDRVLIHIDKYYFTIINIKEAYIETIRFSNLIKINGKDDSNLCTIYYDLYPNKKLASRVHFVF